MKRPSTRKFLFALALLPAFAVPASAEWKLPTWLGGKPSSISKTDNRKSSKSKTTKVNNTSGKSLFTNPKNLFAHKPKGKVVSQWPKEGAKPAAPKRKKPGDEPSWLSRMFGSSEPPPPRSVAEWMELDQIKP